MAVHHKHTASEEVQKKTRRNMIKLALFGGAAFVLGKVFNSVTEHFSDKVIRNVDFQNFNFQESEKKLTISEKDGEPLLIIEKDSFK
ncbi:MAG: hypothetical protein V4519_02290 [Patescibacteria group bacterium]